MYVSNSSSQLVLITLILATSALVSESRVARKDLGVDLGGIGVGVGIGLAPAVLLQAPVVVEVMRDPKLDRTRGHVPGLVRAEVPEK
ncbi:unnamed protein product [Arabis nemorensis]|uniref:Uncharacterized protein n=1 Tax=Arabis nemorensis TaxID=586526 RepID=A0A565CBF9_9BRAS|nr:unnamed protein product [Arabis nemorensis]